MTDPLSVDIDLLLTGGDGDLPFPELTIFSSARRDIFGMESFSINVEGNLDLLCLPEEQVLACKYNFRFREYKLHFIVIQFPNII